MNARSLALLALIVSCGSAIAQPPPPDNQRPGDPLRGPRIRDRQVPGVNNTFGEPGGDKKRLVAENKLPPPVFREAMETILSPDAPENLRVTDEQRTRFTGWMDDFKKSIGAYMKEHQQELRELRAKTGDGPQGKRPGEKGEPPRPPQGDEMRPENAPPNEKDAASARERFQALMQGAPKIEDLYTKIWTELKPDQQRAVDARIAEFRAQQAKEREENYVRQKSGKKKGPQGQPEQPSGQPPQIGDPKHLRPNAQTGGPDQPGHGIDPQRHERLMRIFSQLTPEQQEQLLQRLEQRMREQGGPNQPPVPGRPGRRGGDQGPGEPKPAPEPDDSMMPPPPTPNHQPAAEPQHKP